MESQSNLKRVKDEGIFLSLLFGAKEVGLQTFIWKIIGGEKHLAQVKIESIRKSRKDFCLVPLEGQSKKAQELMAANTLIDIYIPESGLLCRCQIKQLDAPNRYYLHFPQFVAQVERRSSLRLNVHDSAAVKVSFFKTVLTPRSMTQQFQKTCLDISGGGLSFYVSRMELKFFQSSDPISLMEIKFGESTLRLDGTITAIRETAPDEFNHLNYRAWRVCVKFTQIDQLTKKKIDNFIFEQIRKELHAINE